jgi:hypothetical protein
MIEKKELPFMIQLPLFGSQLSRLLLGTLAVLAIAFLLVFGNFLSVRPSHNTTTSATVIAQNANLSDTEKTFSLQMSYSYTNRDGIDLVWNQQS